MTQMKMTQPFSGCSGRPVACHSLLWLSRVIAGALVLRKSTLWIIPYPVYMMQQCNGAALASGRGRILRGQQERQ